jgi:hypothetical protein
MTPFDDDYSKPKPMEWASIMDKGQQSQPLNATPFVTALKKRLNHPTMKGTASAADMTGGKAMPAPMAGDMTAGKGSAMAAPTQSKSGGIGGLFGKSLH